MEPKSLDIHDRFHAVPQQLHSGTSSKTYVDNSYNRELVSVRGYTRSDGTEVSGYTRSVPRSTSATSRGTSSKTYVDNSYNRELVSVRGYTRSDGTEVSGYTRSVPRSTSATSSGTSSKTYVDNSYNRELGRVGEPLGSHPVHSAAVAQQLQAV